MSTVSDFLFLCLCNCPLWEYTVSQKTFPCHWAVVTAHFEGYANNQQGKMRDPIGTVNGLLVWIPSIPFLAFKTKLV